MALSLVPVARIDDAWMEIEADAPAPDHPADLKLRQFKNYVIDNWLENSNVFPRVLWNHYGYELRFRLRITECRDNS